MFLLFLSSIWACPRVSRLPCRRRTLLVPNRRIRAPLRSLRSVSTVNALSLTYLGSLNEMLVVVFSSADWPALDKVPPTGTCSWFFVRMVC